MTGAMTAVLAGRWYRPPEVLLNMHYNEKVDVWSVVRRGASGKGSAWGAAPSRGHAPGQGTAAVQLLAPAWLLGCSCCGRCTLKHTPTSPHAPQGCLFAELLFNRPLFPGRSHIDQLALVAAGLQAILPEHVPMLREAYAAQVRGGGRWGGGGWGRGPFQGLPQPLVSGN